VEAAPRLTRLAHRLIGNERAMRMLLILVALIGIAFVVGMYLSSRARTRPKADTQPEVPGGARPDEFPEPGAPSPHRADGSPVPGSREDRHDHGKP
jgi:hypothetical protein